MSLCSKRIFVGFIYYFFYKSNEEVEETLLRDFIENRIMQKLSYSHHEKKHQQHVREKKIKIKEKQRKTKEKNVLFSAKNN